MCNRITLAVLFIVHSLPLDSAYCYSVKFGINVVAFPELFPSY
jgi:hypothetical protein